MHESGPARFIMKEVEAVAREHGAGKVVAVKLKMGALCPFSHSHVREHFAHVAEGTIAEHALLVIEQGDDITDPAAQQLLLESIEVEDPAPEILAAR